MRKLPFQHARAFFLRPYLAPLAQPRHLSFLSPRNLHILCSQRALALRPALTRTMSSDADYASFLDKANQDTTSAATPQSTGPRYGSKSVDTGVPAALERVQEYYVSDADEPFEPVALRFTGKKSISAELLSELLGGMDVQEDTPSGFESRYKTVVDAVRKAGNGEVRVFRVGGDGGTRSEVWVVGVDEGEGKVVGLKALSVES